MNRFVPYSTLRKVSDDKNDNPIPAYSSRYFLESDNALEIPIILSDIPRVMDRSTHHSIQKPNSALMQELMSFKLTFTTGYSLRDIESTELPSLGSFYHECSRYDGTSPTKEENTVYLSEGQEDGSDVTTMRKESSELNSRDFQ